jgi:anhydro-N-acetylmuramic acid kinase
LIKGINYSYPEHIRAKIFSAFRGDITVKELCQLNFAVGKCFADASNVLIGEFGKPDLISSHGQTIYHYPFDEKLDNISLKSTLQIGESSIIAKETGCLTVSNFRENDIAVGGQGAPLVCFADEKWFKNSLVQNIGGISNVTVVSDECETFGFDTGCGNIMIDYCVQKLFGQKYDKDGAIAASGNMCESWLDSLLQDEYYFLEPPKTTGREYFSPKYIENILKSAPPEPKDIIATLTALTAKSIAQAYERFVYPSVHTDKVIVGGGGAYNKTMMKFLRTYLPQRIEIKTHEDYGISNNYKEVMAFALLGYCNIYGIPSNIPSCTGANKRVVLGKVTVL